MIHYLKTNNETTFKRVPGDPEHKNLCVSFLIAQNHP